ncbi:uncharacterized protein METZ01_LOCUS141025 [marine metagenome]|uniref:Uncharacterized protein n=1 Tax=marine metagenome TaxID=408172 RepID=A0A381ZGP7_9ZZZZ
MAKNKSEKCPHLSEYGGGYIRHDQWITEKLCANIAKSENTELPDRFWNLPKWSNIFRRQVALAAGLLLSFRAEAVFATLRDKRLYKMYSFLAFGKIPSFYKILTDNQNRLLVNELLPEVELTVRHTDAISSLPKRNNLLSRLNRIDVERKK